MKVFILKWLTGWAGLFESIVFIITFGFVALNWKLYMAKQYSKARFLPNSDTRSPKEAYSPQRTSCRGR